ncbi:MAG: roadblock/LC7 domain-containing protein [Candidatus Thorarchaeota archaeon]|nr:roadblock/LC7 domain-containing protein [Candidatus Thorarchaeota archaeon]
MVDKAKIENIVAEVMAANADIQGIVVCDAKGKVIFGHTVTEDVNQTEVAKLAVKIAGNSAQLVSGLEQGGLKEVTIASEKGLVVILGDVEMVLAGIAGETAREAMGLIRIALRRALLNMVGD